MRLIITQLQKYNKRAIIFNNEYECIISFVNKKKFYDSISIQIHS